MQVQVQYTDKAAVDGSLPAFAHAGSCTVVQCIALQFKGVPEQWNREGSPVTAVHLLTKSLADNRRFLSGKGKKSRQARGRKEGFRLRGPAYWHQLVCSAFEVQQGTALAVKLFRTLVDSRSLWVIGSNTLSTKIGAL